MSQPFLTAAQIRDAVDLKEDIVEIPEWGGSVRLVQMTAAESLEMTKLMSVQAHADDGIFLMLVFSAKDAEGNRLFTIEDVLELKKKNFNVLNTLQRRAITLNRNGIEDKAVLKKDLSGTAIDDSPSAIAAITSASGT
jgi:hypothetical protein